MGSPSNRVDDAYQGALEPAAFSASSPDHCDGGGCFVRRDSMVASSDDSIERADDEACRLDARDGLSCFLYRSRAMATGIASRAETRKKDGGGGGGSWPRGKGPGLGVWGYLW